MTTIKRHTVSVPDAKIAQLHEKLTHATFPDELEDADWDYGTPLSEVKRLAEHWREKYNWRATEAAINALPTFMASNIEVEGYGSLDIHFLHIKSGRKDAVPLLFLHGWPGNFLEVTRLLPHLESIAKDGGPAFDVVSPSLPNYGFSSRVGKRGFGLPQYAETCHKLMLALGYTQYVAQGGDWGSLVSRMMARLYPTHLVAIHLNLVILTPPPVSSPLSFIAFLARHALGWYTPAEKAGLERTQETMKSGLGYFAQQTTRPQTLAYSLNDSPVGLLAWVLDKLYSWSDEFKWSDDEVCTWVCMYWFATGGPGASLNMYYESVRGPSEPLSVGKFHLKGTKLGLAYFPKEMMRMPKAWNTSIGDTVIYEREHERGGHFAAWEQPQAIAEDLKAMFGKGGAAFGCVEGKSGYE